MRQESYFVPQSKEIMRLIDQAGDKAGLSRGQAFEDFLSLLKCELAGRTMEEEYLATVAKGYAKGEIGKRGIDIMVKAGQQLIGAMIETEKDVRPPLRNHVCREPRFEWSPRLGGMDEHALARGSPGLQGRVVLQ